MPLITANVLVPQPREVVWATLKDIRAVAECMPGVELIEEADNDVFKGGLRTKLGAIHANFDGEAKITINEETKSGRIDARGVDSKGGSRASAEIQYSTYEDSVGTRLDISAEIKLQGRLAQFGKSGLLQDICDQMVDTFGKNLAERASRGDTAVLVREVKVGSLFRRALWSSTRGFLSSHRRQSAMGEE